MNCQWVRTRDAYRYAAQEESSIARMPTPNLGVNKNDPIIDNMSEVSEEFVNMVANPEPVDGAIPQVLLRVLQRIAGGQSGTGGQKFIIERLRLNGDEMFTGVARTTPMIVEY